MKRPPRRESTRSNRKDKTLEPKQINLVGDFDTQLESIMASIRLTQEDVASLNSLFTDLESILQSLWPGCTAVPFGSITTGLGFKTSDVDCFIRIPSEYQQQNPNFVHKVKRLLQRNPHIFTEIRSIPRINMPIVKFFHIPTKTKCDTTFKSPIGTKNSKLITFLLHADPRLIPMAIAVKYWAKINELSGTTKLKNYALVMMMIFYLQQPPISILPSVEWLQKNRADEQIIDHWNAGFMDQTSMLPPCLNTSSISELLGGFFEYYSTFDFEELVVCPFLGKPLRKNAFRNPDDLPDEFQRYKDNVTNNYVLPLKYATPFCIQDPFEHCHNVALPVHKNLASDIKCYFKFAADAYEEEKLNNCQNFLKPILLQKPNIMNVKHVPNTESNGSKKVESSSLSCQILSDDSGTQEIQLEKMKI